jgi:hypothetical protein
MNNLMKNLLTIVIILLSFAIDDAQASSRANWKSVSIETIELRKPIRVTLTEKNDLIGDIVVKIGVAEISVPKKDLLGTNKPQLETLYLGYWDDESLTFYIALKCGVLSSFPEVPLPQVVFYIFHNGDYSHKERYDALLNNPNLDIDLYRLVNRD